MMRILLLSVIVLCGCAKRIYIPQIQTRITTDTITRVEPDSALLRALFECDSMGDVRVRELEHYKGEGAQQQVDFVSGELRVETRWRTQYIDRIRETVDTVTMIEQVEVKTREPYIPSIFWYTMGFTIIGLGYLVLRVVKYFR